MLRRIIRAIPDLPFPGGRLLAVDSYLCTDRLAGAWFAVGPVRESFTDKVEGVAISGPRRGIAVFLVPASWVRDA